jgi:hypothetical protein
MTTTAADIDAAYATLRISTQYMTMPQLDAHVAAVLAMAAAVPTTQLQNLALPGPPPPPPPPSAAQIALQAAQQAVALAAAPVTPPVTVTAPTGP